MPITTAFAVFFKIPLKIKSNTFFTALKCPPLVAPANAVIASPLCPTYYGSSCQIACNSGYQLAGSSSTVTCAVDSNNKPYWTTSTIKCTCEYFQKPVVFAIIVLLND